MAKPKKKMVVLGAHDAQGNKIDIDALMKGQRPEKRYLALHYTPKSVRVNVKALLDDMKKEKAAEELINLFEDIYTITAWAETKLPLVAPPKAKPDEKS